MGAKRFRAGRSVWLACGLAGLLLTGALWAGGPEGAQRALAAATADSCEGGVAPGAGGGARGGGDESGARGDDDESGAGGKDNGKGGGKSSSAEPKMLHVDLDKAVEVKLPRAAADLRPAAFKTSDGREGWVVRLPGGRPIATPAFADGRLYVGGGYGSHEFYAFDAETGRLVWRINAGDDGPTAAVVEDGLVAFNTESCTLVVVDAKTGKLVWQEWLGDPLMSQPAIWQGRVYIAYPAGQRGNGRVRQQKTPRPDDTEAGSHRLLCADLRTGKHLWERAISGDVISAPVIDDGRVLLTTFDGTSYAFGAADGRTVWKHQNAGTSAPTPARGKVVVARKRKQGRDSYEGLQMLDAQGQSNDAPLVAADKAEYLNEDKGGGVALTARQEQALDASVGFGSAPAAARLDAANKHIGVKTVAGGWAYQGSRAAYSRGRMLNAQGRYLNSVSASDGRTAWRAQVRGRNVTEGAQVFSPPSLGERLMYLTGSLGHLLAVGQEDGEPRFLYAFGRPLVFQPALAGGSVFFGTADGLLVCLKTGDADADGWHAWGGNAQHNKSK